jgi:hypothetical protein
MRIRLVVFPILLFVSVSGATRAAAQPAGSRFEVGVQATMLRFSDFEQTNTGIGGRVSFDLSRWAAVEAEGTSPRQRHTHPAVTTFTHNIPDLQVAYHGGGRTHSSA